MFGRLSQRAAGRAEARAERRRQELAERMAAAGVKGVAVAVEGERVVLTGRGLGRRLVVEPALRWIVAESKDG